MAYTTIDKPDDYFNTIIYSGNNSNPRTLTGVGFQPDFVWLKNRTNSNGHTLADVIRGANKTLSSDGNGAEITDKNDGHLDAFTSDGFTVGAGTSSDDRVNDGAYTYVAWNWLANGAGVSNSDGTITSTVSANTTSGFSIVSYTGTGANATVGHGLGAVPRMIIVKNRDAADAWQVYHAANTANPETDYLVLNTTAATADNINRWNDTLPTSTLFSIGDGVEVNTNTEKYIAYCFAEKKGYSKFGSYTGNGSTDGTFVYTGFKPAFVMWKCTDDLGENWCILDNKRDTFNLSVRRISAEASSAEAVGGAAGTAIFDMLSNGFKHRGSGAVSNGSGNNYIYMAFAENPFVTSTSIPTTAR